jgi:hypothetical protein
MRKTCGSLRCDKSADTTKMPRLTDAANNQSTTSNKPRFDVMVMALGRLCDDFATIPVFTFFTDWAF